MVRKRRGGARPTAVVACLLSLLLLLISLDVASSYRRVGCIFSKQVCKPEIEVCYDDNAFGRCLILDENILEDDSYQYDLMPEELNLMRLELQRLEYLGYKWTDDYTQCVMQILLDDVRYRTNTEVESRCKNFRLRSDIPYDEENQIIDKDVGGRLGEVELKDQDEADEEDEGEEEPVAIVKFTPSKINPHGEFADEFYYPPEVRQRMAEQQQQQQQQDEERRIAAAARTGYDKAYPVPYQRFYDELRDAEDNGEVYRRGSRSLSKSSLAQQQLQQQQQHQQQLQQQQILSYPKENFVISREYMDALRDYLESKATGDDLEFLPSSDKKSLGSIVVDENDAEEDEEQEEQENYEKTFSRKYKQQKQPAADSFVDDDRDDGRYDANDEDDDEIKDLEDEGEDEENDEDDDGFVEPRPIDRPFTRQRQQQQQQQQESSDIYDSLTISPTLRDALRAKDYEDLSLDDLSGMLWGHDSTGFKRRERLDVKKPGPLFSTNNYAFKTQSPASTSDVESNDEARQLMNDIIYPPVKKEIYSKFDKPASSDNVDLDHVYIQFKQDINSWPEGNKIVQLVGKLIGLKPGELNNIRVGRAEVTFKVSKNSKDYNATDIIARIGEIREDLKKQLQVDVSRVGIGDKTKLPAMLEIQKKPEEMSTSMFGALFAAGVAAACAAALVILLIAYRHAKSRAKLAGLRNPDPEASKDYQELCRARMASKQQPEKQQPQPSDSPKGFDFGRLIESGRSESRSSTSSWSEEPPNSNIDVATGHLVLSYMEDHLKNQEKLDEEWAALCAYEAEPCSTAVAESNSDRNRAGAALPYDHSRIVLNDLANLKSSDYINASTITDHDPRNPAYIATQGPLPQTTADFWQLVWEQGSVVIVMLTRLTEEGQAMCHRYWPDEGSETYHIYEIHIVSEHIWCDDYLVRSFYLKNLRTGETRTVTQFHFLSWPNNSVPKSTKALLEFRRKVNKSYRGRSCPIIVHCSDGAGRTGTYCLIDMLLNRMSKGAKEIDLAATLEHIRDQRPNMVATKQQFEFVLMAVAEEIHAILKTLPAVADKSEKQSAAATTTTTTKSDK